ncbi:PREDICTED: uncharacterized protein LOC105566222 [Vollenhovia emeryi]|uniref:uncharacterized protein LOC105566222 n=1 Tax=Vollenhovia emeryi TaxID=411798 RepID=UPI0005F3F343|nr:PREDICTED: uncharacterized protein LOC105566222 [Vollenhovia emeryi]
MSRQLSRCYLLFYLSASAILACGSPRRIPRGASCPSCSQDCPEALTVQLPWNPRQESNLRDFSINPLQNSPNSRLIQQEFSQDIARDDNIPLSRNSMSGNYRRFLQPTRENFFFRNYPNNSPKSFGRQEIFSEDKPTREYPLIPSNQIFDRSENLFFRNPRNKFSESLTEDERTKDYKKIEEDPMSKVLVVYRADRDTNPSWKNSRDTSDVTQPDRSLPKVENTYSLRQKDIPDEERNAIRKSFNSAGQLRYPQERYPIELNLSEVKRTPYTKDTDTLRSTKEVFDNWDVAKDSSQSSNLKLRNNFLEVHPAKKSEIIARNDNEQINFNSYNSKVPQGSNIWNTRKDEGLLEDSLTKTNTRPFENEDDDAMKEYYDDETEHFMGEKDIMEYFDEDETEQDPIETERDNYNPHVPSEDIWKGTENKELFDDLHFVREDSQEIGQPGYSEENNKYFQAEQDEDVIFKDKKYTDAKPARAPVINAYNAYILPRYLNVINDKEHSAKSETQELSEAKNSVRANPIKEMDRRFFEDEAIENNKRIQDFIFSDDIINAEEYSPSVVDKRNNVKNKNEDPIELDPDLLSDIEDPPVATTESTPMQSSVEFS